MKLSVVSLPIISHYWASIFHEPVALPAPGGAGGFNSLKRIREEHNIATVACVVCLFNAVLRIMDRVEQDVFPLTSDPIAFKTSFSGDFTMLSVTAAIIAQVAITALALPNLNQVHWTATAGFIVSLVTGCLSVWTSTTASRLLSRLNSPNAIRDWLSKPASNDARAKFEKDLKARLVTADPTSASEVEDIEHSISTFLEENRWKIPSFYSCTLLAPPSLLLNSSLLSFLVALGIYLGTVWKKRLDPVAGNVASRAVLICYVVCVVLGYGLFFGASDRKEAETDFVRRWMVEVGKKEVKVGGVDIEAGGNEERASQRRELASGNTVQGTVSVVHEDGEGKNGTLEIVPTPAHR